MTIHELLALTGLTESDEIPVWDAEASGEPTKKITAQNLAAAIKTLASLLGTGDVVNNLTSGGTTVPLSAEMGKTLNDKLTTEAIKALLIPTSRLDSTHDMNSVDIGVYLQSGSSMPSNAPIGANNAYIVVLSVRNNDRFQLWFSINTGVIYYRTTSDWGNGSSSVWSSWRQFNVTAI